MGQELQKPIITIFLFITFSLMWGCNAMTLAQISLESKNQLEVRFSQGQSERNKNTVTVSLSEIESVFSPEFSLSKNQWHPFGEGEIREANYYVSESNAFAAPGRMQINDFPHQTFFVTSLQNNSGHSFGNLVIAFDFIYNFYGWSDTYNLNLKYRVNDGEWRDSQSGIINESSLLSVDDDWSSFSIHLNLDDIYLRDSDMIHLMWVLDESKNPVGSQIPLALQRMEIYPDEIDQNSLNKGDLVITEILPKTNVNGSDFEYVEIYNPGESPVSLKGVELITPLGSRVIQQDIFAEPYDYTVIANVDISNLESVGNSYFYNGSIVAENGGRIELEYDGNLIASATYEAPEPGLAVELSRVSRAYDGYSSLQDFVPSRSSYYQDLYGSPGVGGSTNPMFTKKIAEKGFYLMAFPGSAITRLNRHVTLEYYTLDGNALSIESIESGTPVIVHKTDDKPLTIYIEGDIKQNSGIDAPVQLTSGSTIISIPTYSDEADGLEKRPENNISLGSPITQVWNQQSQKFELKFADQSVKNHWDFFILNKSVTDLMHGAESRTSSPLLDRFIEFALVNESNGSSSSSEDVAILGFLDTPPVQSDELRYDLPKLAFHHSTTGSEVRQPLLYLASTFSQENYNSFTHLPFEIDQKHEIGIGTDAGENAVSTVLKWNLKNDIPDEWVLSLEDTFSGTVVDLREANEYRFRLSSRSDNVDSDEENETPRISTLSQQDRPRFVLTVEPYESFSDEAQEEEKPDSIELRPNYPNPFNPSTNINFFLPEERPVRLGIYNIVGQQVALLLDDTVQQGEHSLVWDASDKPSGIYIVQLETGNRIFTRKITLIK